MRAMLLAAALAAAFVAAPAAPAYAAFDRPCSGKVDTFCYHDFCGIYECTRSDCLVYSGLLGGGNAGLCVGLPRG